MRVLVACECSGAVRDAFLARGHEAVSCDLIPSEQPGPHILGDALERLDDGWDMLIAFPPCTYLAGSGLHWNGRIPGRREKTEAALEFVRRLLNAPVNRIALENPVGCIGTRIRRPDQTIQPYEYGHDASKRTCLWLKNLPRLKPTMYVKPRIVDGRPRWSNQTDSGQNILTPSETRAADRAKTYAGIAKAMAEQWG
ncbi:MAG TPA: hypothetical protein VNH18_06450 [Bryobacteraceae bacterium]|nr:hypothetical protein [Bryobacteraceae bacterium]